VRLDGDLLPVAREILGRPPRESLCGERWVPRAAGAHHAGAENTEVRRFVRKTPTVPPIGLGVVAHPRAAIRVRRRAHGAERATLHGNGAGRAIPLLHLVLDEPSRLPLVLLVI